MTIGYFALFALYFVAVASDSSDGKCVLKPTNNERTIVYSCVHVEFDAVDGINSEAEWIEFTVSKLVHLPSRAFARFHLRALSFYDCDIRDIDPNAFDGLPNLKSLTFYESNIKIVKASWFSGLQSLTLLSLPKNNLLYIEPGVFPFVPYLEHLNLEDNDLNCLPSRALAPLRKLKYIRIEKNPWLCSCYDDLVDWMKYRGISDESRNERSSRECMIDRFSSTTNTNTTYRIFSNYSSSQGESYISISSDGDARCVGKTISALSEIPDNAKSITFSNSQISSIPEFAFFKFGNTLRSLEFDGSNVRDIKPEAFAGLAKLERLVLFNNSLETVKSEWIREIQRLKLLSLEGNGITNIEPSVYLYLQNLVTLNLNSNELKCLPIERLALLSNLKKVQIADNPWNCSCRDELTKWFVDHQIAYAMNQGTCRYGEIQTRGRGEYNRVQSSFQNVSREQWSGYRNASFQRKTETFIGENSTDYHYIPLTVRTQNNQVVQTSSEKATHIERQQELRLPELKREDVTQATVSIIRKHEQESRNQREPSRPCSRINDGIPPSPNSVRLPSNCTVRVKPPDNRYPAACIMILSWHTAREIEYKCPNRSAVDLQQIPRDVTEATVRYSLIPKVPDYAFRKLANTLVYLELSNCGIRNIDPRAFDDLVNLQQLILTGNNITVVRAEWFKNTYNLQKLVVSQNLIDRIEADVFQNLPNLYELQLRQNQLNCLSINELSQLNRLARIDIRQNPWQCLCLPKLMEMLDKRRIRYHKEHLLKHGHCIGDRPVFTPPPTGITTEREMETKPPVPTMMILSTMQPDINVSPLPPARKRCVVDRGTCTCNGGDLWDLNYVRNNVEIIEFRNATISLVQADAFRRFTNLKKLAFYNCNIHKIDDDAFRGLRGLEWLIIENTRTPTIRSAWFRDLGALTHLVLKHDSIVEIESEVFQYTRNLRLLSLEHNNLRCIYTNVLLPLTKLERMEIDKNSLKWRCKNELIEFLNARNCTYTIQVNDSECNICAPANYTMPIPSGATDESISTVNVFIASLTMFILTKF